MNNCMWGPIGAIVGRLVGPMWATHIGPLDFVRGIKLGPINLMDKPTNTPYSYHWDFTWQPINLLGKSTYIPCSYHWDSTGQPIDLMGKSTYIPCSYYWHLTGQPINSVGKPTRIQCCSTRHPKSCKTGATWSTIIPKHYIYQYLRVYFYQLTVMTEFTYNNCTQKSKHITDHFNLELARERFRISFFRTSTPRSRAMVNHLTTSVSKSTLLHLLVARFFFTSSEKQQWAMRSNYTSR